MILKILITLYFLIGLAVIGLGILAVLDGQYLGVMGFVFGGYIVVDAIKG